MNKLNKFDSIKKTKINKVQVYILTLNHNSKRYISLSSLFCLDYFDIHPTTIPKDRKNDKSQLLIETLKKAPNNKWILYIKDNSITNANTSLIKDIIYQSIDYYNNKKEWDLFYLSKWFDRCDLYTKSKDYIYRLHNSWITRTYSPNGEQAILLSPKGVRKILDIEKTQNENINYEYKNIIKKIEDGSLIAITITPNLFSYDVLMSKNVSDLAKTSECRKPNLLPKNEPKTKNKSITETLSPFVWFLLIVIIVIFILWVLYQLGIKNKVKKYPEIKK